MECYKCGTNDVTEKKVRKAGHTGTHVSCNKCVGTPGNKGKYPIGGFTTYTGAYKMFCRYRSCKNMDGECKTCEHMTAEIIA